IPVTVTDDNGATDTTQIQITVTGTNDAPVAGAEVTTTIDEGAAAISGQLTSSDLDDDATAAFTITEGVDAPAGFVLDEEGNYSFDPADPAYDHLNVGDTKVLTIPVTVTDDNGGTDTTQIQITVTGTNDAPIASLDEVTVEEGASAISGQLTTFDADDDATATFAVTEDAELPAGFVLNLDGSYSFDPTDPSYDHLNVGDSTILTIPVTATFYDGATDITQIQITVTGTNDAPVAGAEVTMTLDEGSVSISGQLTSTDLDDDATAAFTITGGEEAPAGFVLNADGSYNFDPTDPAYDHLDVGVEEVITIPVTVTDDNGATDTTQIQITITGTNDTPVAAFDTVRISVDEGQSLIGGQLIATDMDDNATVLFSISKGFETPAGFVLNEDGSCTFDPTDPVYDHLNVGDSYTVMVPVVARDENGAVDTMMVNITVNGTNDAPVANLETTFVAEGATSITGQLTSSDMDDDATATYTITEGREVPAGFELNEDGSYAFDPTDPVYDHLNVGDFQIVTVPVTVTDDNGETVSSRVNIVVTGTNDAPVASTEVVATVDEGSAAINGQLTSSDLDDDATAAFTITEGVDAPAGFVL
ncbi:MAG: VCBS domain-containing protein, partial [Sedimenticola sp.]